MRKTKKEFRLPPKGFIIFAIFSAIILLVAVLLLNCLKNLSLFTIREVTVRQGAAIDLSYLKGKNIFSVDLELESRYAWRRYPVYKKIRLIRMLPDRIFVDFVSRRPLALVKLNAKYFSVDDDAILFDAGLILKPADPAWQVLPVISGLGPKIPNPKSACKYYVPELDFGLQVIREAGKNKGFKDYRIISLDLSSPDSAVMLLTLPSLANAGIVEVKLGREDIISRLRILEGLLYQFKKDWNSIKYIDLRFREPAIKFNDMNNNEKGARR